jgi:hypothetical protein
VGDKRRKDEKGRDHFLFKIMNRITFKIILKKIN